MGIASIKNLSMFLLLLQLTIHSYKEFSIWFLEGSKTSSYVWDCLRGIFPYLVPTFYWPW